MVDSDKAIDTEEQRAYEMFNENKKVRLVTDRHLWDLMKKGKFELISEFKFRRPGLRKHIEDLEIEYWEFVDKQNAKWK